MVSVSGGRDSMALLGLCFELKKKALIKELSAFHANHGTRPENAQEEALVRTFCLERSIPLKVAHLKMPGAKLSNFENRARLARRNALLERLDHDAWAFSAHTIDDSFEWSLMQQMRSGELQSSLGIPLFAPPLIRPMMCFTRQQVDQIMRLTSWPYADDPSNLDTHYLRNYVRKNVVPKLKERFPQYLRLYVERNQQLAILLGLDRQSQLSQGHGFDQGIDLSIPHIAILRHPQGQGPWDGAEGVLRQLIRQLSSKKRGRIGKEVAKLVQAARHAPKGPMRFSGGVRAWAKKGAIILASSQIDEQDLLYFLDCFSRRPVE